MPIINTGKKALDIFLSKRNIIFLALLLFFVFMVRVFLFHFSGFKGDLGAFEGWFNTAATYGPRVFYNKVNWVDYPPLNVYIFWLFGSIAKSLSLFGSPNIIYIIKLPPTIFDVATSTLIFTFVQKRFGLKTALLATTVYAFNPAVIFNSAIWGQFDAIYTFFLILSLILIVDSRPKLATVAFVLGILTKPQSIALAPLIVFLIFRNFNWRKLVASLGAAFVTVFTVILPLEWTGGNPVSFLIDIYFNAYKTYAYTSINAFNIWGLGGMWKPDTQKIFSINLYVMGWILFGILVAFTLYFVYRHLGVSKEIVILFSAFLLFFGFFMLPTRIHERYLFPAMSVLVLLTPFLSKMRLIYVILSATYLINQAYVLSYLNASSYIPDGDPVVLITCLVNLGVFLFVLLLMWKGLGKQFLVMRT